MTLSYAGRWGPQPFLDSRGNAMPALALIVYERGTTTKATLYADRTRADEVANPVATTSLGNGEFFADPGEYDVLANGRTLEVSVLADPGDLELRAELTDRRFDPARANRVIYIGDSITFGDSDPANVDYVGLYDYPAWAEKLSDSQIIRYRNAGLGGNDSINLLADLEDTVLQYADRIGWCVVMCGTNDAYYGNLGTAGYTFATYKAAMTEVVAQLRAAGIRPVLCTITPRDKASSPLGLRQRIEQYNAWLRVFAATDGVPLVDTRAAVIDPATNEMVANIDGDGLHPSSWGDFALGQAVADTLGDLFPPWVPPLADHEGDADYNLATGGLFLVDGGALGVGDGWQADYLLGTASRVTPSAGSPVKGKWQRLAHTGNSHVFQPIASATASPKGWAVGDRLGLGCWIEGTFPIDGGSGYPMLFANGFTTAIRPHGSVMPDPVADQHIGPYLFWREFTVPAGTTTLDLWLSRYGGVPATVSGWVQFAQVTLLNLTRLGLVVP